MPAAIAPVGERRVVVDTDNVDRGRRPERIERKTHFACAAIHHMRAILSPIRAVSDDGACAEDRLHVGGERDQLRDRRINAGRRAHARETAQFRANQKRIDAARIRGKLRVVQHHAAIAPVGDTRAEERIDLRCRC